MARIIPSLARRSGEAVVASTDSAVPGDSRAACIGHAAQVGRVRSASCRDTDGCGVGTSGGYASLHRVSTAQWLDSSDRLTLPLIASLASRALCMKPLPGEHLFYSCEVTTKGLTNSMCNMGLFETGRFQRRAWGNVEWTLLLVTRRRGLAVPPPARRR
jgi:hypothetical protein